MRNLSNACVFGEFLLWIVLQCYWGLRLDGRRRAVILWGTMMKPSAVVCPVCLANLSSSVWPSFSLLMRVGMQGSLIMALPLDWNFVKQRGAPGRPQYGRTGEDCHPPRLAAPGSCHTRNSVPVMHGRLFEVQRPSPLPRDSARISRSDCNSHCGRDGDITSAESRTASEATDDQREHW